MEKPQELADIQTLDRSFRLLDTNIYLVLMRRADGAKSLSVTVDDATAAIVQLDGKTVNWTIYEGDWGHSVAGVPITSELRAVLAIEQGMFR